MIVCGVDLGVRKAAISIFSDCELMHVSHLELRAGGVRADELMQVASWSYSKLKIADHVFIEEPLAGRSVRTSLQIAQTAGAVMSRLGMQHMTSQFIDNKKWKKAVVGSGNASKEEIRNWLVKAHSAYAEQCEANQDRIDAVCIGLYGCQLIDRSTRLAHL